MKQETIGTQCCMPHHSAAWLSLVVLALSLLSCTDTLFNSSEDTGQAGLQFEVSTTEMVEEMSATDPYKAHALSGNNPYGLKVHREHLPLVGIHRAAVGGIDAGTTSHPESATANNGLSRAGANEVVATNGTNFHDSLTIWGYTNGSTTLFDQILLTKVRNWRTSIEWPYGEGEYMKFYAVAPSLESINMSATRADDAAYTVAPTLTFTMPEEVKEMRDVLYGESENISVNSGPAGSTTTNPKQENLGKDNKLIGLSFHHILSAIRFSQGIIPAGLTINSISVEGVRKTGTFLPGNTDPATLTNGQWTIANDAPTGNYSISTDFSGTDGVPVTNVYIDGGKVMFMIPQTLTASARLVIELTETGSSKSHRLTCSLRDDVWKKGYTVNYKITIGELEEGYYLTTEAVAELEHSNNPVNGTLPVHSYHLYSDYSSGVRTESYRPMTWTIEGYSTDGITFSDSRPTWLTDFHGVLSDGAYVGGSNAEASFTVARQEMARTTSHDVVLSENSKAGVTSHDLSRYNPNDVGKSAPYATRQPANCYIVNRIGSYNFPLVYGNMNEDNPSQKSCFKDHQGNTITRHAIRNQINAKSPSDADSHTLTEYLWLRDTNAEKGINEGTLRAVLLWQDVPGLITEVALNENAGAEGNIQFIVGQSIPGNAVIALQARKITYADTWDNINSSSTHSYGPWETLWTWHIWMTDEVYKNDGKEDEQFFDTYYTNGPTANIQADHIATLLNDDGSPLAQILPVDLGWVPDVMSFGEYDERSVWVKLSQSTSHKEAVVKLSQHARQQLVNGTGTVYQWGRPTAFPSLRNVEGKLRPIYDIAGNDISSQFVMGQATSSADAIARPWDVLQWETNANAWFDIASADYANALWSTTEKTVYDPCPAGFQMPSVSIFKGFSKTNATVVSGSGQLNMWPETADLNGEIQKNGERLKGGFFYLKPHSGEIPDADRYGAMVYMPSTGEWHGNKTVGTMMTDATTQLNNGIGIYWTADYVKDGTSQACALWLTPEQSFSSGTAEKPVIGFFDTASKLNYYASVRGIRPKKTP